jgi:hypothetical protein
MQFTMFALVVASVRAEFRGMIVLMLLFGDTCQCHRLPLLKWHTALLYVISASAGFSAVPIFTTLMISSFNMIFTACPIVAYAVLEQDMHVKTVLANPASYAVTRTATRGGFFW